MIQASQSMPLCIAPLLRGLRLLGVAAMVGLIALMPLISVPAVAYADAQSDAGANAQGPVHPIDLCAQEGRASSCITAVFYYLFVETTAIFTYFGGVVFDYVASIALDSGAYADTLINTGWTLARDLANMAFLFLVVFLGIRLILNIEGVGAGKTLAKILAVALVINFSFFFTRVVIDASNLLAHQFYDHINGRTSAAATENTRGGQILVDGKPLQVKYISENIMGGLNVQQVIGNASFKKQIDAGGLFGNIAILTGLFLVFGIINLILAFIFFVAAIQFIARIVALWLTIMLAPLGFLALIIPGMAKWSRVWWDTLIKNALFAPAFLFVFYLIVMFLDAGLLGAGTGQALYSAGNAQGPGTTPDSFFSPLVSIVIRLAIVVALLKTALKVGEYFGQSSARSIVDGSLRYAGPAAVLGLSGMRMLGGRMLATAPAPAAGASAVTRPARIPTVDMASKFGQPPPSARKSLDDAGVSDVATRALLGLPMKDVAMPSTTGQGAAGAAASPAQTAPASEPSAPPKAAAPVPTDTAEQPPSSRPISTSGESAPAKLESAGRPNVFSQRERTNNEIANEIRNVTGKVEEVREALAPLKTLESSAPERPASSTSSMGTLDRLRDSVAAESAARSAGEASQNESPEADAIRNSALRDSLSQVEKATKSLSATQSRQAPPQAPAAATPQPQGPRPPLSSAASIEPQPERSPTLQQAADGRISQVERLSRQVVEETDRIDRNATNALKNLKRGLGDSSPDAAVADVPPPDLRGGMSA